MAKKLDFYCTKCKTTVSCDNYEIVDTKNKRKMAKGKCNCGTTVCKFVSNK